MTQNDDHQVAHDSVMPEFVVYDQATGEFVNKYTGVVLNRICFVRASGIVSEYPRDPKEMICGCMPRSDSEIARLTGTNNLICIQKVGVDIQSKKIVGHAGDHEDKHGYKWTHEESIGSV